MDENRFWSIIESAWAAAGGHDDERHRLAWDRIPEASAYELGDVLSAEVIPALRELLDRLSAEELLAFDRILERKLYDIDRADVHVHTDGSDDGFLYCRGFIVGMGRAYYEAVSANPDRAVVDAECGRLTYLSWHMYREKFGDPPRSGISRETQSNQAGWAED